MLSIWAPRSSRNAPSSSTGIAAWKLTESWPSLPRASRTRSPREVPLGAGGRAWARRPEIRIFQSLGGTARFCQGGWREAEICGSPLAQKVQAHAIADDYVAGKTSDSSTDMLYST